MAELGYPDDDGARLEMLDGKLLRAARDVVDIGVHCDLSVPTEVGGGRWTYDEAWRFLNAHTDIAKGVLRFAA